MPFAPIINARVYDTNEKTKALTGDENILIRYHSNAFATMTATPQGGASINEDMYIIRNGNETGYGSYHVFNGVESNVFSFSAEDSDGNIGKETISLPIINYVKLTCNITSTKIDSSGTITLSCWGDYYNGSFGAVSNTLTVSCRYKQSGSATYSQSYFMNVVTNNSTYTATYTLTGLDYSKAYDFEIEAIDELGLSGMATATAYNVQSKPIFHWGKSDIVFEVDTTVNGSAKVKGSVLLQGDGNYGNAVYFGDGTYCYIAEETDDVMTIVGRNGINLVTKNLTLNNQTIAEYGTWTPTLDGNAVRTYNIQSGWYNKVGNVVTVGFFIKATCNSGYETTNIYIFDLPYTPAKKASGGGMCSGALIPIEQTFQCFVAEEDNTISARVQACDNRTSDVLVTSASGCKYPSAGNVLTLSGTITYLTN